MMLNGLRCNYGAYVFNVVFLICITYILMMTLYVILKI